MKRVPEIIFAIDGVYESQAVKEAHSLKLISFGILNTNGDDTVFNNMIPANTNSIKSLEFLANVLKECLSNLKIVKAVAPIKKMAPKVASTPKKEEAKTEVKPKEMKAEVKAPVKEVKAEVKKAPAKKEEAKAKTK